MVIEAAIAFLADKLLGRFIDEFMTRPEFDRFRELVNRSSMAYLLRIAIAKALIASHSELNEADYPFFDRGFLEKEEVFKELMKLLKPNERPDITIIENAWKKQFTNPLSIDIRRKILSFMHALENELLAEPRLNNFLLEKKFERVETYLETNDAYQQYLIDQLGRLLIVYDKLAKDESELSDNESVPFSNPIRDRLAKVNQKISELTKEQIEALKQLQYGKKRMAIKGCAGSGKTLLAAQKGIWFSEAGIRTLILCHSPLLANYIRSLVMGSRVDVIDFSSWVYQLLGQEGAVRFDGWTHFIEPLDSDLGKAFDVLTKTPALRYDAIIVDEGQDFKEIWWYVVESGLLNQDGGWLYIFYDDNQSLLPLRSEYLALLETIVMSKNCRNSGEVFRFVRSFHDQSPNFSPELANEGIVRVWAYQAGNETEAVKDAVRYSLENIDPERIVVLTSEAEPVRQSILNQLTIDISTIGAWQDVIAETFSHLIHRYHAEIELPKLSTSISPTQDDIVKVNNTANAILKKLTLEGFSMEYHEKQLKNLDWGIDSSGKLSFGRKYRSQSLLYLLTQSNWADEIPKSRQFSLSTNYWWVNTIPLYSISSYKGLEADSIILFVRSPIDEMETYLYVGASRARLFLGVVVDRITYSRFKQIYDWGDNLNDQQLQVLV